MRILFAVSNSEDSKGDIVDVICNEYQKEYKKIISYKRAFYYDAIVNEIKQTRDNKYDRIIITENLYKHMDEITDEAYKDDGTQIPIILLCSDRRTERDPIISKLFVLGVYNVLFGRDRTIQNVCALIEKPRNKKLAKIAYNINPQILKYDGVNEQKLISDRQMHSILKFFNLNKDNIEKCVKGFAKLAREYNDAQLQLIINSLPLDVKIVLEENSKDYLNIAKVSVKKLYNSEKKNSYVSRDLTTESALSGSDVIIPNQNSRKGIFRKFNGKK